MKKRIASLLLSIAVLMLSGCDILGTQPKTMIESVSSGGSTM